MAWIVFIYFMVVWLWLGAALEKKKKSSPFILAFIWALLLTMPVMGVMSAISNRSNTDEEPPKTLINTTNSPIMTEPSAKAEMPIKIAKPLNIPDNTNFIQRFSESLEDLGHPFWSDGWGSSDDGLKVTLYNENVLITVGVVSESNRAIESVLISITEHGKSMPNFKNSFAILALIKTLMPTMSKNEAMTLMRQLTKNMNSKKDVKNVLISNGIRYSCDGSNMTAISCFVDNATD